jgi:hypothetical protein
LRFSVRRKVKYLAVGVGAQTNAAFMRALAITRGFCGIGAHPLWG